MRNCTCYNDDGMRMLGKALAYAMTEFYARFRRTRKVNFLFWEIDHEETVDVHIPKHHEDNYSEKRIQFKKECIELIDVGYSNGSVTQELADAWRIEISEYQQRKGEVWE